MERLRIEKGEVRLASLVLVCLLLSSLVSSLILIRPVSAELFASPSQTVDNSVFVSSQTIDQSIVDTPSTSPSLGGDILGFNWAIVEEDPSGIIIDFSVGDIQIDEKEVGGDKFYVLTITDCGITSEVGKPQLPVIRQFFAVPPEGDVSVRVLDADYSPTQLEYNPYPIQTPLTDDNDESENFEIDEIFYSSDVFYPAGVAEICSSGRLRDYRVVQVEIHPVQFNPASKELRIYHNLKVKLEFSGEVEPAKSETSPYFEGTYRDLIINYDYVEKGTTNDVKSSPRSESLGADYLIITHENFYEGVQPIAEWKEEKGLAVKTVTTSEVYARYPGLANDAAIHKYIENAYENWALPPSYVLLVGEVDFLPTHYGMWHDYEGMYTATDLYYSCVAGDDYFSDVFVGRIPVKDTSELGVIVDKIVGYESDPYMVENDWYLKATCFYWLAAQYAEYPQFIRDILLNNGYTHVDTFYDYPGGQETAEVRDAINNGRTLLTYFGHGDITYWYNVPFYQWDVLALNNGHKLPVVLSMACRTGWFDVPSPYDCMGETWLKALNGAVAFWGSSRVSWTDYDIELIKGVYKAIFNDGLRALGEITSKAKLYMYNYFGHNGLRTQIQFELFNVLGDPELNIWTEIPGRPTSRVDSIPSFWRPSPSTITASAQDADGAIGDIALWYRYSTNNLSWGPWTLYAVDGEEPWEWEFNAPNGDGYYEFYSIATDIDGNVEQQLVRADARCRIDTTIPSEPIPQLPEDDAVVDNTPTFRWSSVEDIAGVTYTLQYSTNPTFQNAVTIESLPEHTYTVPDENALVEGKYYWRVRAVDGASNSSEWSDVWQFTVNLTSISHTTTADFESGTLENLSASGDEVKLSLPLAWSQTYDDLGAIAADIAVDQSNNVYITGTTYGANKDWLTVKYDEDGNILWARVHDISINDIAEGIAVDSSGNVYVTGYCVYDYLDECVTAKYYENGDIAWVRTYYGDYRNPDYGRGVAVDSLGYVYVLGYAIDPDQGYDFYFLIKYDGNGNVVYAQTHYLGDETRAKGIAINSSGYMYTDHLYFIVSSDGINYLIRYDYYPDQQGSDMWTIICNSDIEFVDIEVDYLNNAYITGTRKGAKDYYTAKYNEVGYLLWEKIYDYEDDNAAGVTVDSSGNVYITGTSKSQSDPSTWNYSTIKYDTNGNFVWSEVYNSGECECNAAGVAVDSAGNVYVTGSVNLGDNYCYRTIKYLQSHPPSGILTSNLVSSSGCISSVTATWNADVPEDTSLEVEVSDDGGSTWYPVTNGETVVFSGLGSILRYRLTLSTSDDMKTPVLYDITLCGNSTPRGPTLISPPNCSFTEDNTPTFRWTARSDPSGVTYTLQYKSNDFQDVNGDLDHDYDVDEDDYQIIQTAIGHSVGDPAYNSEADYDGDGTVTLVDYQIWIMYYRDFIEIVTVIEDLIDNTYTVPEDKELPNDNCYWRVKVIDGEGNSSDWSDVWQFTVDSMYVPTPELLKAVTGTLTNENILTFDWTDVSDSSGVTYTLEIDDSMDFSSPVLAKMGLVMSEYTLSSGEELADGTYYWRVRAVDGDGISSEWSNTWVFAICEPEWQRRWVGEFYDEGYGVAVGSDGIYVAGVVDYYSHDNALLLKYDVDGNLLWERTWSLSNDNDSAIFQDVAQDVAVGSDGVYVVVNTRGAVSSRSLLKYDFDGNLLWENTWSGIGYAAAIAVCSDGIYVVGQTSSYESGACLSKYDTDGNLLWERIWGGDTYDSARGVAAGSGCVYVVGQTYDVNWKTYSVLWKFDEDGNLLWENTWGPGPYTHSAYDVVVETGGIYVAGGMFNVGTGDDVFLLKYDVDGDLLWQDTWDPGWSADEFAAGVAADSDGVYVTCRTSGWDYAYGNVALLKYSFSGELVSEQRVLRRSDEPQYHEDYGFNVHDIAVGSNGIYMTGCVVSGSAETGDVFLVKCRKLTPPELLQPQDGTNTGDKTPFFNWTDVNYPLELTYKLEISDDADFSSPVLIKSSLTESEYTLTTEETLTLGTYYWHVQTVDIVGNASDWSEVWHFTVLERVPIEPILITDRYIART